RDNDLFNPCGYDIKTYVFKPLTLHSRTIRAAPNDPMAFTKAVFTIVAYVLVPLGHRLQLPCKFMFCQQGHLVTEPQEEALLCLEAIEVRAKYRVLLATDQAGAMWAGPMFVTPGISVWEVIDEQLFSECPGASEIALAGLVRVRVELQSGAPSPIAVLATGQEQDLSVVPPQL
ncbi:hypothetical protein NDU88_001498, partial [Pleurodeles waltl]